MAPKKVLIIRLSSLGDVILSCAALEALPPEVVCDWLVAKEFAPILEGHPRIRKLWAFDRNLGLVGWWQLGRELLRERYAEIYDLHRSLRSHFLWAQFRISLSSAQWSSLAKGRCRLWGYFVFKRFWAKNLRPELRVREFVQRVGGTGAERPKLLKLASKKQVEIPYPDREFLCVMPASRWPAKEWPVDRFVELFKSLHLPVVVLGTEKDQASLQLVNQLQPFGIEVLSGVGRWDLQECANVLSRSRAYVGVDTGLAHLAEAVGVPAVMIFGPTQPDQGFGPWRAESLALGSDLWCRPCGKDGRYCFRSGEEKYLCMKVLSPDMAGQQISKHLGLGVKT